MSRMYFDGKFQIKPPLEAHHLSYLDKFCRIRHVKWDVSQLEALRDPLRKVVNLPLETEGDYYVGWEENFDNHKHPAIINYNLPPKGQPALWCDWRVTGNGEYLMWMGEVDKYYYYKSWLEYLLTHFFIPWNYVLLGHIECEYHFRKYASEDDDEGVQYIQKSDLFIDNNTVIEKKLDN